MNARVCVYVLSVVSKIIKVYDVHEGSSARYPCLISSARYPCTLPITNKQCTLPMHVTHALPFQNRAGPDLPFFFPAIKIPPPFPVLFLSLTCILSYPLLPYPSTPLTCTRVSSFPFLSFLILHTHTDPSSLHNPHPSTPHTHTLHTQTVLPCSLHTSHTHTLHTHTIPLLSTHLKHTHASHAHSFCLVFYSLPPIEVL